MYIVDQNKKLEFTNKIMNWYKINKRIFPWRYSKDSYKIWISETLLQQTDSDKALYAYKKIIEKYPDSFSLSKATTKELEEIFKSIGLFYRIGRIKNAAQYICNVYGGVLPKEKNQLKRIKGIGDYIASAIMCFAYGEKCSVVDTNVIRIFERIFKIESNKSRVRNDKDIWTFADGLVNQDNPIDYNYAILDLGALICTANSPKCGECPMIYICDYFDTFIDGMDY